MNMRALILTCTAAMALPMASFAMQLKFPANSTLAGEKIVALGSYHLPISAWNDGDLKTIPTEGEITKQAWKIAASDLTSLQILDPLKQQLIDSGFYIAFECETENCGGFDFRYQIKIMPEPVMHIDLGDFRFLSAKKPDGENSEYVSLLISRSQNAGYVQLTRVGLPREASEPVTSTKSPALTTNPVSNVPLAQALDGQGYFILEDLVFQTGSSELGDDAFSSLSTLADYLNANPSRTVALVGHTDSEGSLAGNIALSKKRARSVVKRLISDLGVNKTQLSAEGNGFLSPRASNLTEDGRAQNRRVEVIVTSTQ